MTPDTRQLEHIERTLSVFHPHAGAAGVVELRALGVGGKRAVCSVHADMAELARRAAELDAQGASGCYFTINPLRPDLVTSRASCKDGDVIERRWLPIDIDPCRPAGVSSSQAELEAAWRVLCRCRAELAELASPVVGCSGNGWHLCYPILLPNDEISKELVRGILRGLDARCGDTLSQAEKDAIEAGQPLSMPRARVDTTTFNASRIWRLYGCQNRKGAASTERPHRWARLIEYGGVHAN